jgi:hypothetical protein
MKALLCSAVLALSAIAIPASATPQSHAPRSQLPPGCFVVLYVIYCVDMPIEP